MQKVIQIGNARDVHVHGEFTWARVLAACSPRIHCWLVNRQILHAPANFAAERNYLKWFVHEFRARNLGELTYVPLAGIPRSEVRSHDYSPARYPGRPAFIERIRQDVWLLRSAALGLGEDAEGSMSASGARARLVRDVAGLLETSKTPMILLGHPGSGKSTTLREVGVRVAERSAKRVNGLIPVYVSLGSYRHGRDRDAAEDIMRLIEQSIPVAHKDLRTAPSELMREGRLLVLFDGMDEMERTIYAERVQKLGQFARDHSGSTRTLFSCRTNDFLPTFGCRQIVLMPFTRAQIREYVRANFVLPAVIEGGRWSLRALTRRLIETPQLDIGNPLILFLVRHFIVTKRRLPDRSSELFDTYLDSVVTRYHEYEKNYGVRPLSASVLRDGWSALAFEIARERGGAFLELAELKRRWGEERVLPIVESGIRSGLLTVEFAASPEESASEVEAVSTTDTALPGDQDSVGFFHHRIQEYLCAQFLASHSDAEDALAWETLVDSPRWQETLVHLVGMRGQAAGAMRVLEENFGRIEKEYARIAQARGRVTNASRGVILAQMAIPQENKYNHSRTICSAEHTRRSEELQKRIRKLKAADDALDWSIRPERERILADRLVLSARLLGEPGTRSDPALEPMRRRLTSAVREMAARARPTTQLKMIAAWKSASAVIPLNALETPIRSPISWLRNQVVLAVSSLAWNRESGSGSLAHELSLDFLSRTLLSRLRIYGKATENNLPGRMLVMWAASLYVLYVGSVLTSTVLAAYVTALTLPHEAALSISWIAGHELLSAFLFPLIVSLLFTLISSTFPTPSALARYGLMVGACCLGMVWVSAGESPARVDLPDWYLSSAGMRAVAPAAFIAASSIASFWIAFALLRISVALSRRSGSTTAPLTSMDFQGDDFIAAVSLMACAVAGALATDWILERVLAPAIALVLLGVAGVEAFELLRRLRQNPPTTRRVLRVPRIGVLVTVVILIGLVLIPRLFVFIDWLTPEGTGRVLGILVVTPLAIGSVLAVGALLYMLMSHWISTLYWRLRLMAWQRGAQAPAPMEMVEWQKKIRKGKAYQQAVLLEVVTREQLSLPTREALLMLIEKCERDIKEEPAISIYWRRRHELEEELRQGDAGGLPAAHS